METGGKKCEQIWDYLEVKKVALLNEFEIDYFEKKLNQNFLKLTFDYKECPECKSLIERTDMSTLRVKCLICEKIFEKDYEFCWNCEQRWPYLNDYMDRTFRIFCQVDTKKTCGRRDCLSKHIEVLAKCKYVRFKNCPDLGLLPSIRACVTCGELIEHTTEMCKNGNGHSFTRKIFPI